ncbi:HAMP domain-containing methyl-accepting chemotaxis protein [Sphingomonas xinjiangensis]|uniref:Methyl-accepting chemotaxis protein n=1 Tax=Sphingomonas xinjiangensis TaxID=643568 RepID=A0A840YIL6_9SPHN|nr:methyl-accepting chemotaxis protein [Sphingomonas xinjiangensis]MBB5710728.1 methyl-accepting chemotaxis protein [Sphingomonas xinjiangensis]
MLEMINNWRLEKKLVVAFTVIGLLMAGVAGAGIYVMSELGAIATRHVERGVAGTETLGRLMSHLREHRIIVISQLTPTNDGDRQKYVDRYAANKEAIKKAVADYEPLAGEFLPELKAIDADIAKLEDVNEQVFKLTLSQGMAVALPYSKSEGKDASSTVLKQAEALIALQQKRSTAANDAGQAFASKAFWAVLILSAMGLLALAAIWKLIVKTVSSPLTDVSKATSVLAAGGTAEVPHRNRADELGEVAKAVELFRVAAVERAEADRVAAEAQRIVTSTLRDGLSSLSQGDLTAQIKADYPADYAELKTNFNEALSSLRGLIGSVSESAIAIRTGSGEIAQASEDLARRTEANAASLEETSAAVTQMDGRLKATADAANRTVVRADGAISTVEGGRTIADEAVQAMARVADGAKGIDSVIEGLDKIAFQTRVLAMNAAVEAGRAGEAGRGFAVVADLVSALAMRSEEEAARARDQLTATQTDIVSAVEMVQKVDGALANISGDVAEVHSLLGQMAADNQAQSTAISQISVAIGTMDQSTQQNAAMVEQTSAAARNLTSEVATLAEQAAKFDVGAAAAPRSFRPAAPQPRTKSAGYTSPVKPLPVSISAQAEDDWASF